MGRPIERWYWGLLLLGSIIILSYFCYGNVVRYRSNDIEIETRLEVQDEFQMPRLTVCFQDLSHELSCYGGKTIFGEKTCLTKSNSTLQYVQYHFKSLQPIKAQRVGDHCWDINKEGNMSMKGTTDIFSITVVDGNKYDSIPEVSLFTQDPDDSKHMKTDQWPMFSDMTQTPFQPGQYVVDINIVNITRLKDPYPSKCVDEIESEDLFSLKYTRMTCFETCSFKQLLKKCGDVLPYWKKFVSKDMDRNGTYFSDKERRSCMKKHLMELDYAKCDCGVRCKAVSYGFEFYPYSSVDFKRVDLENASIWHFVIGTADNRIKTLTEKPAYTFSEFSADLGGHFGLLLGLSVMSFFEFFAFLVVCVASFIKRRH